MRRKLHNGKVLVKCASAYPETESVPLMDALAPSSISLEEFNDTSFSFPIEKDIPVFGKEVEKDIPDINYEDIFSEDVLTEDVETAKEAKEVTKRAFTIFDETISSEDKKEEQLKDLINFDGYYDEIRPIDDTDENIYTKKKKLEPYKIAILVFGFILGVFLITFNITKLM